MASPTQSLLGNDVVDIGPVDVRAKHQDTRFVERVLAPSELAGLKAARDPGFFLWAAWSAKESAFKINRREDTDAIFAHQRYILDDGTIENLTKLSPVKDGAEMNFQGRFHAGGWIVADGVESELRWLFSHDFIHCVATVPLPPETYHHLRIVAEVVPENTESTDTRGFDSMELESIRSEESIKVRSLAKKVLVRELGVDAVRVVRHKLPDGGFGPPEAHLKTHQAAAWMIPSSGLVQLSLSHDGRYLAVAAVVPTAMAAQTPVPKPAKRTVPPPPARRG